MEFRFNTRAEAKDSPFFFTDEECNVGGTLYGWSIVIVDELESAAPPEESAIGQSTDDVLKWDSYCAALARRFARRNDPVLGYDDLFQEARLKACILTADQSYPSADPSLYSTDDFVRLSPEEEDALSAEEKRCYRVLRDTVRFRTALRRALIDYTNKHG